MRILKEEKEAGNLPPDLDLKVFHVAVFSMYLGYGLFRERIAAEAGLTLQTLDRRMNAMHRELVRHLMSWKQDD